jgi:hypothetical protein
MQFKFVAIVASLALGSFAIVHANQAGTAESPTRSSSPSVKSFRGCLQGDAAKGFSLLAATGDGSGSDTKGQTMTYRVVAVTKTVDLMKMVNKVVDISGTLATDRGNTGQIPAPVTDSARSTAGAGGTGRPGENTAFYFANGTLTAQSIREVSATCATRSAPNADK